LDIYGEELLAPATPKLKEYPFPCRGDRDPHNMYASPNITKVIKSKSMRWVENVERMGKMRNIYNILVGKTEGKRPLGRSRRKWENNIKMDLRELW
jgi:hypothetical protein